MAILTGGLAKGYLGVPQRLACRAKTSSNTFVSSSANWQTKIHNNDSTFYVIMKCNSSQRFVCCVHSNSFQRISSIVDLAWPGDRSQVTNCTFLVNEIHKWHTFLHGLLNNPYPIFFEILMCLYLAKNKQSNNQETTQGHDCMMALESNTLPWQFFSNSSDRSSFQLFTSEIQLLRFRLVNWIFFLGGGGGITV